MITMACPSMMNISCWWVRVLLRWFTVSSDSRMRNVRGVTISPRLMIFSPFCTMPIDDGMRCKSSYWAFCDFKLS